VPTANIAGSKDSGKVSDEMVEEILEFKSVKVVVTRLLGLGRVTRPYYTRNERMEREYEGQRAARRCNLLTQASYLGEAISCLASEVLRAGNLDEQLGKLLNVRSQRARWSRSSFSIQRLMNSPYVFHSSSIG